MKQYIKKLLPIWILSVTLLLLLCIYCAQLTKPSIYETDDIATTAMDISTDILQIYPTEAFSNKDFKITIFHSDNTTDDDCQIYYTLDGSVPTTNDNLYSRPIDITCSDNIEAITIRASLYRNNELSVPFTKTYFVGKSVYERYTTMVVSIVTDEENLYDYEKGILIEGKAYDDYQNTNTGKPANYMMRGDDWIRDAHIEVFTPTGDTLVSQNVGISIAGQTSSKHPAKSFDVKADYMYDSVDSFYNFVNYDLLNPVTKYMVGDETNHVRLRNSGNDFNATLIRQNVANELALQSGLNPISGNTPVVTYLNGEYYSIHQVQNKFSRSNVADALSLDKDKLEIIKGSEKRCARDGGFSELANSDFNDPVIRQQFEELVDIDDMFLYYAIELFLCNTDWPNNNYGIFRTTEIIPNNPYGDGKWHFLMYDTDHMWRLFNDDELFEEICNLQNTESIFTNMLRYEPYRQKFVNICCDLVSTSFSPENVASVFDFYIKQIQEEIPHLKETNNVEIAQIAEHWDSRLESLTFYTDERMKYLINIYLWEYFQAADPYTLEIQTSDSGIIHCNTLNLDKSYDVFQGTYYSNYPIDVSATAKPGYTFSHFLINDEEYYENTITLTSDLIMEGKITLEAVYDISYSGAPTISNWSSYERNDWIELTNYHADSISLKGYFISDSKTDPFKCPCPDVILAPGETIRILCKSNPETGPYITNFNLKPMETITLCNENGIVSQEEYIFGTKP